MERIDDANSIDFVVLWVDSNDENWRKQRDTFAQIERPDDYCGGEQRYRDWDLFKFWFRGVEKYAPWVRKVHLVTCGHLPEWINQNHPKLNIVTHREIIPNEFLPIFNSCGIELCIHNIKDLNERFVYFNDDFYILDTLKEEMFFHHGVPCSTAGFSLSLNMNAVFVCSLFHDTQLLNRNFNSRVVLKKHWHKFLNYRYGIRKNMKSMILLPWCRYWFPGFAYEHGPNAFLKSTFVKVWEKEERTLRETCSHRFRQYNDVNQYIFKWWQCCEGNFFPIDERKIYKKTTIDNDTLGLCSMIENPTCPVLVINDAKITDFWSKKEKIQLAFQKRLPEKCSFEL